MDSGKIVSLSILTLLMFGWMNYSSLGSFVFYPLNPFVLLIASIIMSVKDRFKPPVFYAFLLGYVLGEFLSSQLFLSNFVKHEDLENLSDGLYFMTVQIFAKLCLLFLALFSIKETYFPFRKWVNYALVPLFLFAFGLDFFVMQALILLGVLFLQILDARKRTCWNQANWWILQNFVFISTLIFIYLQNS